MACASASARFSHPGLYMSQAARETCSLKCVFLKSVKETFFN